MEADQRPRHDDRPRRGAEGRGRGAGGGCGRGGGARCGRAEPEVIKKGKTDKARRSSCRAEQDASEAALSASATPVASTPGRGTTSGSTSSICWRRGTGWSGRRRRPRRWWRSGGWPARSSQAADVHEPQRAGGRRPAAVLQDRARPICSSSSTRCSCELGRLRDAGRGSAGGHNGLKSLIERSGPTSLRGCGSASGAVMPGAISRITCWRSSTADERAVIAEAVGRAADAVELFVAEGIGPVMNRFNRKEDAKDASS